MAAIELVGIGVSYPDGTRALDGVSLTVPEGKVMAMLGPSGSGKSTALKVVGGLLPATDGRVVVRGEDITALPSEQRNVGIVFQSYALFPNMTVEDNIGFGLKVRGVAPAPRRERVVAMLRAMKIEHLRDKRTRQISGGEAQRVALARAMVFNPRILLMDEPLSALDAQIRDDLRAELRRFLLEFRTTTIYVTHDQTEALALGDQVAVMRRGRVVQVGTPAEIYGRPASLFVAAFIGNANLIPCTSDGGRRLTMAFGAVEARRATTAGEHVLMFRPEDVSIGGRYVLRVYGKTILFSLQLAVVSVILTTVIGVAASYALVRYRFAGQGLIEEIVLLPMSIPGIAVAIALIQAHTTLRPTWYIILAGHLLYTMPFMIRAVTNTPRSFDFIELEQAAASLGATWWQRMRWIILPNLKHAILIGSLLVFAISLGEFNASFLLNTPINQTYPAALYDTYNLDSFQVSSAATTVFMLMLFPALVALQYVGGRELEDAGQGA